jgi:hypothetical protein
MYRECFELQLYHDSDCNRQWRETLFQVDSEDYDFDILFLMEVLLMLPMISIRLNLIVLPVVVESLVKLTLRLQFHLS